MYSGHEPFPRHRHGFGEQRGLRAEVHVHAAGRDRGEIGDVFHGRPVESAMPELRHRRVEDLRTGRRLAVVLRHTCVGDQMAVAGVYTDPESCGADQVGTPPDCTECGPVEVPNSDGDACEECPAG